MKHSDLCRWCEPQCRTRWQECARSQSFVHLGSFGPQQSLATSAVTNKAEDPHAVATGLPPTGWPRVLRAATPEPPAGAASGSTLSQGAQRRGPGDCRARPSPAPLVLAGNGKATCQARPLVVALFKGKIVSEERSFCKAFRLKEYRSCNE